MQSLSVQAKGLQSIIIINLCAKAALQKYMSTYYDIKNLVTMQEICSMYGIPVNRSGFANCVFHSGDHTASLKIYPGSGGFHCFGCGAHGSVIDFVMRLFDLNFRQAVLRINADFRLGLTPGKPDRAARSAALDARREEQRRKDQAEENFRYVASELHYWREVLEVFPPVRQGDTVYYYPLYVEAVKRLPYIEYWLDDFIEKGGKEHWMKCPLTPAMTI